jgi:putative membrane protein
MLPRLNLDVFGIVLKFALGATIAIWTASGSARAQASAAPSTAQFLQIVASTDAFEQRAGKVAQVMGSSLEVRRFSRAMVDEHAKSAQALGNAASTAQIPAPTADLSPAQAATVKDLYAVPAKDFDRTYITDEIDSHQQALEAVQAYAAGGDNPAMQAVAASLAPTIQRRLDEAKAILGNVR